MSVKIKEVITIVKNERFEIVIDGGFHLEYFGQVIKSEESFSIFITSSYKPITDEMRVWVTKLNQYQNSIVESGYWTTKQLMDNPTFRHDIFAALQDHVGPDAGNHEIIADKITASPKLVREGVVEAELMQLSRIIDRAVDNGDRETFYEATAMYNRVREGNEVFVN